MERTALFIGWFIYFNPGLCWYQQSMRTVVNHMKQPRMSEAPWTDSVSVFSAVCTSCSISCDQQQLILTCVSLACGIVYSVTK